MAVCLHLEVLLLKAARQPHPGKERATAPLSSQASQPGMSNQQAAATWLAVCLQQHTGSDGRGAHPLGGAAAEAAAGGVRLRAGCVSSPPSQTAAR